MTNIVLADQSNAHYRDLLVKELVKGGWFQDEESFTGLLKVLNLTGRLITGPLHHLFTVISSDYETLVKMALALWISETKEAATITSLARILFHDGFYNAAAAIGNMAACLDRPEPKPFSSVAGTDVTMKNGTQCVLNTQHQCITVMEEYKGKSLEELRFEDYHVNNRGPQPLLTGRATAFQQSGLFTSTLLPFDVPFRFEGTTGLSSDFFGKRLPNVGIALPRTTPSDFVFGAANYLSLGIPPTTKTTSPSLDGSSMFTFSTISPASFPRPQIRSRRCRQQPRATLSVQNQLKTLGSTGFHEVSTNTLSNIAVLDFDGIRGTGTNVSSAIPSFGTVTAGVVDQSEAGPRDKEHE